MTQTSTLLQGEKIKYSNDCSKADLIKFRTTSGESSLFKDETGQIAQLVVEKEKRVDFNYRIERLTALTALTSLLGCAAIGVPGAAIMGSIMGLIGSQIASLIEERSKSLENAMGMEIEKPIQIDQIDEKFRSVVLEIDINPRLLFSKDLFEELKNYVKVTPNKFRSISNTLDFLLNEFTIEKFGIPMEKITRKFIKNELVYLMLKLREEKM